jgi:hypothetical protein
MPRVKPPVAIEALEVESGALMLQGRYAPHEYCSECAAPILHFNPSMHFRTISVYEILTAYREYRCANCDVLLWDVNGKD